MEAFPTSLVVIAENEIRKLIVRGDLEMGRRVTEAELARRFGMSKTPVREALQQLHREGLVQIRPRQGAFIFSFTEEMAESLRGLRIHLESYAICEAVRKNRGRLLKSVGENIARSTNVLEQGDVQGYLALDKEFHALFFLHADDQILNAAYGAISVKLQVLWRKLVGTYSTLTDWEDSLAEHRRMVACILENDLPGAYRELDFHSRRSKEQICFDDTAGTVADGVIAG
ncbi:GntR family transcriptional regulator [Desulfovibrio sp. OttesenSCG-928-I05]|nr:GntR family transcriptional regulator [Desulfovibrio sp. OttesenSCG-928-I05]